jgi:hypothetical protein
MAEFSLPSSSPAPRVKPQRWKRLGAALHRGVSALSLLDADGNLSVTTVVWLATLVLAAHSLQAGQPLGVLPFALATASAEHRRHLSRARLSDQLRTVDASIKALHLLVSEAKQLSIEAKTGAETAMRELGVSTLSRVGQKRP